MLRAFNNADIETEQTKNPYNSRLKIIGVL